MEAPVKVKILDREFFIRSSDDEEHVHEIAEFVNNRFNEIKDNTEGLSEKGVALLAAFDIASDYFRLMKSRDALVEDIQKRAEALNCQIDSTVGGFTGEGMDVRDGCEPRER